MAANDNLTQPEQGSLQKIRNIGAPMMERLNKALAEVVKIHQQALGEMIEEFSTDQHQGKTPQELAKVFENKVAAISKRGNNV